VSITQQFKNYFEILYCPELHKLLVLENTDNTDIQLHDEFADIQQWADENDMVLKGTLHS